MKTMKRLGLYLLCAIVLAGIRVYSQPPGPPTCGGVPEPPVDGICASGDPEQRCILGPYCEIVTKYGRKGDFCCYVRVDNICVQILGVWKCCYYPNLGEAWTPDCVVIDEVPNATCENEICIVE